MKTMKTWIAIGLCAALGAGCGKKKDGGAETSGGGGEPVAKASGGAATPAAFAAWMPKDAAKAWEGAWSSRMTLQSSKKGYTSMAGDPAALEIKGDKATAFGGGADQQLGFAIETPCEARFSEPITEGSMKGGTAYHDVMFVIENGALVVGSGAGGYRKGKTAVVCSEGSNGGVHIVDDKGCTTWDKKFDTWESTPNTCAWSQKDGKDVLTIGTGDWNTVVTAEGDVLASEQFRQFAKEGYHARATDFAAAKAQVLAKIKENDPGEQAKAAGGVVGKTDTIVSAIATFSADKAAMMGKPLEITAEYLNSNSSTSNGKTTHNVILVDGKDTTKFSMTCDLGETAPPADLSQYKKVTAKGTVGESFGKPELSGCTLTKAP